MIPYSDLTERGQVRRLRHVAASALSQFGYGSTEFRLRKHLVNTTFDVGPTSSRKLLRIHRVPEHTEERIASELAWLRALARETEITVQEPSTTPDGRAIVTIESPHVPMALPVTMLSWVRGRILSQDRRRVSDWRKLGHLLARLHEHASSWQPPTKPDRRTYDASGIFGPESLQPLDESTRRKLPSEVEDGLDLAWSRLASAERDLGRTVDQFGFIHFDLSFSNVLFTGTEARPIDFDECGLGFYLADLAVALAGPFGRDDFEDSYRATIDAYREIRPLSTDDLKYLPAFLSARSSIVMLWALHEGYDMWKSQWHDRLRLQLDPALYPIRWEI